MPEKTQSKVTGAVLMANGCILVETVTDTSGFAPRVTFVLRAPEGREQQIKQLHMACVGRRPFDFDVRLSEYLKHERKLLDIIRKEREQNG